MFLKIRVKADKESEKEEGWVAAKTNQRKAMNELRRIEKAEKIQERLLEKRRLITEKARLKGNSELIKRAEAKEDKEKAILEKIRANKRHTEEEIMVADKEAKVSISESEILKGKAEVKEEEIESGHLKILESYPVNEPYSYVLIEDTSPPTYRISEVGLTIGEEDLLKEIKSILYETMDVSFSDVENIEEFLSEKVEEIIKDFSIELSPERMDRIMYYIRRDLIGYGRLDPILRDKMIEDLSADGPEIPLYVYHRNFGSIKTNIVFDKEELDSLIYRLSQRAGRHISLAKPLLDASLPTKDRLQLSIGSEVTTKGSTFTIRKFREIPITPIDLINMGTFSVEMIAYLWMALENGANILVSGGTASGKTTTLNAISMFIPPESKIISIEDTREINLLHQNWVPLLTREMEEGEHSIEMFDLLKTALRQRPQYILVGEVRGIEASTLFQAMATGHITFSTIHADSAEAVVKRLTKPPINVPLMLLDSLNIIVIQKLTKVGDKGVRRCDKLIEITGLDFEKEALKTNILFRWKPDAFEFTGESSFFGRIMDRLNITEDELSEGFARRIRILQQMKKKGMSDFYSLSNIIFEYSIEPEEVEKRLEK